MKIIIAGSRDFTNYTLLEKVVDKLIIGLKEQSTIISGTARGADRLGERYAKENNLKLLRFPADWHSYGKQAGFIRNTKMAKEGDVLIAFWNGSSAGTKHMIHIAKQMELTVHIIEFNSNKLEDK